MNFRIMSLVAVLSVAAVLPRASFAAEAGSTARRTGSVNFCSVFGSRSLGLLEKLTLSQAKIFSSRRDLVNELEAMRSNLNDRLAKHRKEADELRLKQFERLMERAVDDADKAAVTAYRTTIINAINKRRSAVDSALKGYRSSAVEAHSAFKTSVDAAVQKLKKETQAAIDKAKADCASGKDAVTVRQEFTTSMDAARQNFKDASKAAHQAMKQRLESLGQARREAVKKAQEEFKLSAEKAREALKEILNP